VPWVRSGLVVALLWAPMTLPAADIPPDVQQTGTTLFRAAQQFWTQQIGALGGQYRAPKLAFFSGAIQGACGVSSALAGPFYCPTNETVYLDSALLQPPEARLHGSADAADAYLIGHEVAHHVQNIIGTTALVQQSRARSAPQIASRTLAAFELQADCYAGLWLRWAAANHTLKLPEDLAAALHAPAGQAMLDPWAATTAAQRLKWVRRGLDSGNFNDCDTFGAESAGTL
jgi:predicted metalloprotease